MSDSGVLMNRYVRLYYAPPNKIRWFEQISYIAKAFKPTSHAAFEREYKVTCE